MPVLVSRDRVLILRDWERVSHKCNKAQEGNKCFVLLFMHVNKPDVAIVLITVVEASISKLDQSEAGLGDLNLDDVKATRMIGRRELRVSLNRSEYGKSLIAIEITSSITVEHFITLVINAYYF